MGKHADALKPFDQFRAPWETEGGEDAEIDKPKLKRWIHGILTDKAKAQDTRDELEEKVKEAEKELETAQGELEKANGPEAQRKIDQLQKKVDDLTAERDKIKADQEYAELRTEVLGGLDPKYAKYVVGTTREELEKSLEEVKTDFGLEDGEPAEDDPADVVRTRPRATLRNGGDPLSGKGGTGDYDFDKVADEIIGNPFG